MFSMTLFVVNRLLGTIGTFTQDLYRHAFMDRRYYTVIFRQKY